MLFLISSLLLIAMAGGNLLPVDPGGGHHHEHHHHQPDDHHHHAHGEDHHHAAEHHHKHDHHQHEERGGRADDQSKSRDELIDFAQAVMDPETGLKCVFKNVTVQSLEKAGKGLVFISIYTLFTKINRKNYFWIKSILKERYICSIFTFSSKTKAYISYRVLHSNKQLIHFFSTFYLYYISSYVFDYEMITNVTLIVL
jgi:hypothetical protein